MDFMIAGNAYTAHEDDATAGSTDTSHNTSKKKSEEY